MARQTGTALATMDEELKKEAAELGKRVQAPTGMTIKLGKDKTFRLPNGESSPGPMKVVILDFVARNLYYKRKFKEGDPTPPDCFAIGQDLASLAPSDNSPDKQSEVCASCPQNQWPETKGEPKPCKNTRTLAVMAPKAKGDDPIMLLNVSPTSLKSFDGMVSAVQKMFGKPPIGVVVSVSFDPTKEYQSLRFSDPEPNPNIGYHFSRRAEAKQILNSEPDLSRTIVAGKGAAKRGRTLR